MEAIDLFHTNVFVMLLNYVRKMHEKYSESVFIIRHTYLAIGEVESTTNEWAAAAEAAEAYVCCLILDVWIWSDVKQRNSNQLCVRINMSSLLSLPLHAIRFRSLQFDTTLYIAIFPCSFSLHRQMITKTARIIICLYWTFIRVWRIYMCVCVYFCVHFEMVMAYRFNSIKCASFTPFFLAFRLRLALSPSSSLAGSVRL